MAQKNEVPDFQKMAEMFFKDLSPNIGEIAKGFFKGSFYKGGFTDYGIIMWPQPKVQELHSLMVKSRALRDSIVVSKATPSTVEVEAGRGLPYAEIHNNGGSILVNVTPRMKKFFWAMFKKTGEIEYKWMALTKKKVFTIRIPQRQFIGDSYELNKQIDKYIIQRIQKAQAAVMP